MSESDSTQSAPPALPYCELVKQTTTLCNELDELVTLHHFYYQAAEHFFSNQRLSFRRGLSLLPGWLRERDLDVLERVQRLQEQLRAANQPLNKLSFKPYHGQPFKKYSIFSKKPDGTVKHLGKMLAPNNDLALAKATENFGETIEANCSLFVAQRM